MIRSWLSKPLPLVLLSTWFFLFEGIGGMLVGFFFLLQGSFASTIGLVSPLPTFAGWLTLFRGILFALTALVLLKNLGHGIVLLVFSLAVELVSAVFWSDALAIWLLRLAYLPLLFWQFHSVILRR